MTIYEVKCPFCHFKHLIDSKKHMFRRYEPLDDSAAFATCQANRCNKMFRVATNELKEIKDPNQYISGR